MTTQALRTEKIEPANLRLPVDYQPDKERLSSVLASIKEKTLLHIVCVREAKIIINKVKEYEVFSGELHVYACQQLQVPTIECKVYPNDLDEDEYVEISLHKNLQFPYLTWDEQIIYEKKLHDLRQAQHGPGAKGKQTGWSLRDTAQELRMSFGILSEDLRMAEAVIADPSLKRIKDKTTARRLILDSIKRENQQIQASAPMTSAIDYDCVLHGGAEKLLQLYPANTFDACITDPPWLEYGQGKDSKLVRDEFTLQVFKEVYRVLKQNSFLYAFVSTQDWYHYFNKLTELGFSVQKYPLIWAKENVLTLGTLSWQYQRNYEHIIIAVKGSPALDNNNNSAIFSFPVVPSAKLIHPHEKPKDLIKVILNQCTYEGSLVLDPFAGSGVVLEVAKNLRRRFVGVEVQTEYYNKIKERIK